MDCFDHFLFSSADFIKQPPKVRPGSSGLQSVTDLGHILTGILLTYLGNLAKFLITAKYNSENVNVSLEHTAITVLIIVIWIILNTLRVNESKLTQINNCDITRL